MSGDEQQLKLCLKCNTVKPLIEGFYKCGATRGKECKTCEKQQRIDNRTRRLEQQKQNKAEIVKQMKEILNQRKPTIEVEVWDPDTGEYY